MRLGTSRDLKQLLPTNHSKIKMTWMTENIHGQTIASFVCKLEYVYKVNPSCTANPHVHCFENNGFSSSNQVQCSSVVHKNKTGRECLEVSFFGLSFILGRLSDMKSHLFRNHLITLTQFHTFTCRSCDCRTIFLFAGSWAVPLREFLGWIEPCSMAPQWWK